MISRFLVFLIVLCFFSPSLLSQDERDKIVPKREIRVLIDSVAKSVVHHYIDAEMGQSMAEYIIIKEKEGRYDGVSYDSLGRLLRQDFVKVSGDVHMSAFYNSYKESPKANLLDLRLDDWGGPSNYGYVEIKLSKSQVGYLKIAHFTKWKFLEKAKVAVDRSIKILENAHAIIIDVRGNPGGFEDIVAYLMSYFIEAEDQHLQKYYCRYEDRSRSVQTAETLPGNKLTEQPVYILTDYGTGSAAESFAYMMKHLDRATIVGDTTVGAGNGSTYFRISDKFMIQVATWETINAVTNTSWEKVGVFPDIVTSSEAAFDTAMILAEKSAQEMSDRIKERYENNLSTLVNTIDSFGVQYNATEVMKIIKECRLNDLIYEGDINNMGYDHLSANPLLSEVIFKANVDLHTSSPNVHDSYGEALLINGKKYEAVKAYERAVKMAKKHEPENVSIYQENLEKARKQ